MIKYILTITGIASACIAFVADKTADIFAQSADVFETSNVLDVAQYIAEYRSVAIWADIIATICFALVLLLILLGFAKKFRSSTVNPPRAYQAWEPEDPNNPHPMARPFGVELHK